MSRYYLLLAVSILAVAILFSLTLRADISLAQGTPGSHAFKGSIVNAQGRPVRDGANMKAWIDGNVIAQSTAQSGQYKMIVTQPPGASFSGKTISFTVGQYKVKESAQWQSGSNSVLNLTGETQTNTIDRARGAIAGFMDPNQSGSQNRQPQALQQGSRQLEVEKERRIAQVKLETQQKIDRVQGSVDSEKELHKLDYERELQNIENDSGESGEVSMHQQELDNTQREYDDAKQRNARREHLDELERRIIRVRGNVERAKSQSSGEKNRRISNAKMQYDRSISQGNRELREQLSRINQEMTREISNIDREFGQELRQQKEEAQRNQSQQKRMEMETQSEQKRMEMESQREEQRFKQEEGRMEREMEMQEQRMKREMEMDEQRMRMEEERMRRMGQDRGPGMGPGGQQPEGMAPGEPGKRRGFLMNPKPGTQARGINASMDPTMLTMIGIAITVLATGLTLFKGN